MSLARFGIYPTRCFRSRAPPSVVPTQYSPNVCKNPRVRGVGTLPDCLAECCKENQLYRLNSAVLLSPSFRLDPSVGDLAPFPPLPPPLIPPLLLEALPSPLPVTGGEVDETELEVLVPCLTLFIMTSRYLSVFVNFGTESVDINRKMWSCIWSNKDM